MIVTIILAFLFALSLSTYNHQMSSLRNLMPNDLVGKDVTTVHQVSIQGNPFIVNA